MTPRPLEQFRVLVVPGLHNSGPEHWQSRWQRLHPAFERVLQDDWTLPRLETWSARLTRLRLRDLRPTLLVAHSFGCLAAAHSIARDPGGIAGVLMVAPADPDKFGVAHLLPHGALACPAFMIGSENDPWMSVQKAAQWAARWQSGFVNAGALGHINAESGLGDWQYGQDRLLALVELASVKLVEDARANGVHALNL